MVQCKCELNIGCNNMCLINYNKEKIITKHTPPERSIENRLKEVNMVILGNEMCGHLIFPFIEYEM